MLDGPEARNGTRNGQGALAVALLVLLVVAFFSCVDAVLVPDAGIADAARGPAEAPPGGGQKTLVLFIDSLPFGPTLDAQAMPNLARFKHQAAWVKSTGSRDQVTVPAVRAAFTGSDRFRVFGFVENFTTRATGLDSIFRQWADDGKKVLVYSDDAFAQFGRAGVTQRPVGDPSSAENISEHQRNMFGKALREWGSGSWDVVIFHATFLDEISHSARPMSSRYRWAIAAADQWIGDAMQATQAGQNLLVMGDHGHNWRGVHTMGMRIHTFVGVRGPRFSEGVQLPEHPITLVRYLLSWGTGLPLAASYDGKRFPEALRVGAGGSVPDAYAKEATSVRETRPSRWLAASLTAALSALFGLWVLGARRRWGWGEVAAIIGVSGLVLAANGREWVLLLAAGAGLATLAVRLWSRTLGRLDRFAALSGAVLSAGMVGYGHYLATHVLDERVSWTEGFNVYVPVALGVAAVVSLVLGPKWGTWLCFAAAMLLLPSTNYPWGSVSMWGPALMLLALVYGVAGWIPRFARGDAAPPRSDTFPRALAILGIAWIAQRFWMAVGWDFLFRRFEPLLIGLSAQTRLEWLLGSFFAKLVFLPSWRRDARLHVAAALGIGLLTGYEWGLIPRASLWNLPLLVALFAAAVVLPRRVAEADRRRELCITLLLIALFASFFVLVRNAQGTHVWLSLVAAALALAARLLRPMREDVRRAGQVLLLCVGVIIAGWLDFCWSTTHVEWEILSSSFGAEAIRRHILVFLPAIVGRYAIPVLIFRLVLYAQLGPMDRGQRDWLWTALGLKVGAVAAATFGVGLAVGTASFFLEGVQHVGILLVLSLGLLGTTSEIVPLDRGESVFLWGLVNAAQRVRFSLAFLRR